MTTIRFGAKCDGNGCSTAYNDYSTGDIVLCRDCGKDLCGPCRKATGHSVPPDVCCQDCPAPTTSCEPA